MTKKLPTFPSKERLREIIAFMRDERVRFLKFDQYEIELEDKSPVKTQPLEELQVDRLPELTEEQQKQEEEKNLFWSAG